MTARPVDTTAPALGEWWTKRVSLLDREVPLRAWDVNHLHSFWTFLQGWGVLYLTSHRLVWVPNRLLFGIRYVQIPLEEIASCTVKRSFWRTSFLRSLVVGSHRGTDRWFVPIAGQPKAAAIAQEITDILRERGLLRD